MFLWKMSIISVFPFFGFRLLNFLATDGSDLRLSQGSLGLDSDFANFIEAEQESIDFNTNNEGLGSETISFENFGGPFSFHVNP